MASTTRQALLQALSAAEGAYISGQQLAQQLGVSRAAVHKAAAALTAQGYALEAAPRRGYRLAGGDPFCAEAVGEYDAPIYLYDKLESSTARPDAGPRGCAHGTMVLTVSRRRPGRLGCGSRARRERHLSLAGAAARPAHDRGAGRHRQRGGGRLPGCEAALRAGLGHQVGQRPLL